MSYQRGNPLSLTNGAGALVRGQFVRLDAGLVVSPTAITDDDIIGVAADDTPAGDIANIHMVDGMTIVEVRTAAAILIGARVSTSVNGRAQTAVATQEVAGIALEASGGADEFIKVLLTKVGVTI